jgi:hypothetical protein
LYNYISWFFTHTKFKIVWNERQATQFPFKTLNMTYDRPIIMMLENISFYIFRTTFESLYIQTADSRILCSTLYADISLLSYFVFITLMTMRHVNLSIFNILYYWKYKHFNLAPKSTHFLWKKKQFYVVPLITTETLCFMTYYDALSKMGR